jgi:hypothetical protein
MNDLSKPPPSECELSHCLRSYAWSAHDTRRHQGSNEPLGQGLTMERAMGIEPTSEAWEASILPPYDDRSLFLIVLVNFL